MHLQKHGDDISKYPTKDDRLLKAECIRRTVAFSDHTGNDTDDDHKRERSRSDRTAKRNS